MNNSTVEATESSNPSSNVAIEKWLHRDRFRERWFYRQSSPSSWSAPSSSLSPSSSSIFTWPSSSPPTSSSSAPGTTPGRRKQPCVRIHAMRRNERWVSDYLTHIDPCDPPLDPYRSRRIRTGKSRKRWRLGTLPLGWSGWNPHLHLHSYPHRCL